MFIAIGLYCFFSTKCLFSNANEKFDNLVLFLENILFREWDKMKRKVDIHSLTTAHNLPQSVDALNGQGHDSRHNADQDDGYPHHNDHFCLRCL